MEKNLKNILRKSLEIDIKGRYNNDYDSNMEEINRKFLNQKQNKEKQKLLLDVLIDYFKSSNNNQLIRFIYNILDIDQSLSNEIVQHILNGNLDFNDLKNEIELSGTKPLLVELTLLSKNMEFAHYIFDNLNEDHPIDTAKILGRLIRRLNSKEIGDMLEIVLRKMSLEDLSTYISNIGINSVRDVLKKVLSSFTLSEQTYVWGRIGREYTELFDKVSKQDYTIAGAFHKTKNNEIAIIFDKHTRLYGYIDKDNTIIIPPKFDQISSPNKQGVITGKVTQKIDSLEPGYYKIDDTGKVLEYFT